MDAQSRFLKRRRGRRLRGTGQDVLLLVRDVFKVNCRANNRVKAVREEPMFDLERLGEPGDGAMWEVYGPMRTECHRLAVLRSCNAGGISSKP